MVEFDPLLIGILVGLMGILLWIVTNWHLVRTGKAIKADIDEKRAGTESFVKEELRLLKAELGNELGGEKLEKALQAQIEGLQGDFSKELQNLEGRLQTVQIDPSGIIDQVEARLIPAVVERVEHVKSSIIGSLGYAKKSVKALAEGAVEIVGETAIQEAGFETEWEMRLAQLGMDDAYLKEHKSVAFGLSLLKEAMGQGRNPLQERLQGAKVVREGPPKGFG